MKNKAGEKPILVGGFGEINFGKQYRQGNRVYDSNGIACSLTTNGGGLGSYTGLYTVNTENFRKPPME